ncbi:hypothetical protein BDN71DRAFT_563627 [Pleurotus eryngii]|uniref:Uncharacterized protein n=1 Tax=Pleurotus eryngii TaxID=5323 RepID=A0A9P6A167_PLEER|nr:hypothetical protein BDN71DRAFT_563627 [Pleurotus eryngii]
MQTNLEKILGFGYLRIRQIRPKYQIGYLLFVDKSRRGLGKRLRAEAGCNFMFLLVSSSCLVVGFCLYANNLSALLYPLLLN